MDVRINLIMVKTIVLNVCCVVLCSITIAAQNQNIQNDNQTVSIYMDNITADELLIAEELYNYTDYVRKSPDFQRTQIFVYALTSPGEYIFVRGGLSSRAGRVCTDDLVSDPCAIPIHHRVVPTDPESSYLALSEGDEFLDWYGKEETQGNYSILIPAVGTPLMWTTDKDAPLGETIEINGSGYTPYNRFGEHFWFLDLDMDCNATDDGWFEFKVYRILEEWEKDISQYDRCGGQIHSQKAFTTINHAGMCGQMNVFFEGEDECSIYHIPDTTQPVGETCGLSKMFADQSEDPEGTVDPHIVGGSPVSLGRWPWQGVLQYDDVIGGCGAVLIDTRWALTASHCVWSTWPSVLKVRTGEQNLAVDQGHEQMLRVQKIHIHDCYRSEACGDIPYNDYDLAILELEDSANLDNHVTNIACLPYDYSIDEFVGDECYATGFGDTKGTGYRYRLHQVNVPVHTHADCVEWWGSSSVTERQMCMGTHNTSACGGDSGSPLVCWKQDRWVLAGVTSWGDQDCEGSPSVYSRVSEFMAWIQEITGLKMCAGSH